MDDNYIELNTFLKIHAVAPTGGQVKLIIRSEAVSVNGAVETRNKRKLHAGDKVRYNNKEYIVGAALIRGDKYE